MPATPPGYPYNSLKHLKTPLKRLKEAYLTLKWGHGAMAGFVYILVSCLGYLPRMFLCPLEAQFYPLCASSLTCVA